MANFGAKKSQKGYQIHYYMYKYPFFLKSDCYLHQSNCPISHGCALAVMWWHINQHMTQSWIQSQYQQSGEARKLSTKIVGVIIVATCTNMLPAFLAKSFGSFDRDIDCPFFPCLYCDGIFWCWLQSCLVLWVHHQNFSTQIMFNISEGEHWACFCVS